ncbi:Cleavage and polyadenylation specificity factor subunit 5 [Gracilariopsis chorda]|uniref:Cleavage and polyadenylation specificity factor subunit 5 n=1 Tax=Gracilariopsis chorda TaxID=448386 RepID=A0A2V3IJL6_9FLOR|nr:Cleavage and polyadenylation specificity factor subunit 5 [Gracilariopsis chorda]|eukprot:PXF42249.1 Cleavage and polyadenylation specificity factor subunit 5 [Gracilariopsis chorda]
MDLFHISNYTFGTKDEQARSKAMQSLSKTQLAQILRDNYKQRGIRRSVAAVILVHEHRFPHILLLQRRDGRGEFVLPGGRLRPGESNEEGLQRKLTSKLTPVSPPPPPPPPAASSDQMLELDDQLQQSARPDVGEKLCSWYAIDFDRRYFPYVPAHVTKPKEELHVYAVSLPSKFTFAVPKNLHLLAVPICDVFNNSATYGDIISAIPSVLSRYHFNYC